MDRSQWCAIRADPERAKTVPHVNEMSDRWTARDLNRILCDGGPPCTGPGCVVCAAPFGTSRRKLRRLAREARRGSR
jgi:hypothetical protein